MIFALTRIGVIFSGLYDFLLTDILNWLGVFVFIYGIFFLTQSYPRLASGKEIIALFVMYLFLDMIRVVSILIDPYLIYFDINKTSEFLIALTSTILFTYIIVILLLTYLFRNWFDKNFYYYKRLNTYYYYGLITFIANILIFIPIIRVWYLILITIAGILQVYAGYEIYNRLHKMSQAYKTSTYYPATEELSNYT